MSIYSSDGSNPGGTGWDHLDSLFGPESSISQQALENGVSAKSIENQSKGQSDASLLATRAGRMALGTLAGSDVSGMSKPVTGKRSRELFQVHSDEGIRKEDQIAADKLKILTQAGRDIAMTTSDAAGDQFQTPPRPKKAAASSRSSGTAKASPSGYSPGAGSASSPNYSDYGSPHKRRVRSASRAIRGLNSSFNGSNFTQLPENSPIQQLSKRLKAGITESCLAYTNEDLERQKQADLARNGAITATVVMKPQPDPSSPATYHRRDGIDPEDEPFNEVAAWVVCGGRFNVPLTWLDKFKSPAFHGDSTAHKVVSCQEFVQGSRTLQSYSIGELRTLLQRDDVKAEIRKIAILDMLTFQTDRNLGNILVKKDEETGKYALYPIDNADMAPKGFKGEVIFCWYSRTNPIYKDILNKPLSDDEKKKLFSEPWNKIKEKILSVTKQRYNPDHLKTLELCDQFFKQGVEHGLTLYQLAGLYAYNGYGGHDYHSFFKGVIFNLQEELGPNQEDNEKFKLTFRDRCATLFSKYQEFLAERGNDYRAADLLNHFIDKGLVRKRELDDTQL